MNRTVCFYFLNNSCKKGSECQFLHEKPQESAQQTTATLCKYFAQGHCLKGSYCSFSHSDPNPAEDPCIYFQKGSCRNGDKCAYPHSTTKGPASPERSVEPNDQFDGRCLDDSCSLSTNPIRSLHILPSDPPSFFALGYPVYSPSPYPLQSFTQPFSPLSSYSPPRNPAGEYAAICQSFLRGNCSIQQCRLRHCLKREEMSVLALVPSGDPTRFCPHYYQTGMCDTMQQSRCLFRHCLTEDEIVLVTRLSANEAPPTVAVNGATSPLPSKPSKPCRFFSRGGCNKGDSCPFSHEALPKSSAESVASTPSQDATGDDATWASYDEKDPWGKYTQPSSSSKTAEPVESPSTPPSNRKPLTIPDTALWKEDDPWTDDEQNHPKPSINLSISQNNRQKQDDKRRPRKDRLVSDLEEGQSDGAEDSEQETKGDLWNYNPDPDEWSTPPTQTQSSSSSSSTIAVNECTDKIEAKTQSQAEDEATWTSEWDEKIQRPSRIHKPCLKFGQGFCEFSAEDCVYLHIPDGHAEEGTEVDLKDEPTRPNAEQEVVDVEVEDGDAEAHAIPQTLDSSFFAVYVRFGPGGIPEQVSTPFESSSLTIANLPSTVSEYEIRDLCDSYGEIQNIALEFAAESATATVEYASSAEAAEAASRINNMELLSMQLTARLAIVQPNVMLESNVAHKAARTVKIMWPVNTQTAWVYYSTVSKAKAEEKRINDMVFEGRTVTATFENPKGPNPAYRGVIKIQNLCWDSGEDTVKRLCPTASLISLASKTLYTESSVDPIHQLLRRCGEVDSVTLIQNDKTKKKVVAFARFNSSDAAKQAVAKFDRSVHPFIGNQALSLSLVHSVRYIVPAPAFSAMRSAIDRVSEQHVSKIYFSGPDAQDTVHVVLTTDDSSLLKTLVAKLEQDVHGYVVVDGEGNVLWDDLLETETGSMHLKELNRKIKTAFVMPDFRNQALRVFGPEERRRDATKTVLKFFQKVRAQQHVLPLEGSFSAALLQGGWNKLLQEKNAKSRFSLDLVSGKLVVRGDDAYLEHTKNLVNSCVPSSTVIASPSSLEVCTICALPSPDQWSISCGHTYCKGCLNIFFLSMISPRISSLQCLAKDSDGTRCSTLFSYADLSHFLTPEEVQETLELSFLSYIRGHPEEFRFCPTPHCAMVYRPAKSGTILRCLVCSAWICPSCHVELHEGLDCDEYSEGRVKYITY